MGCILIQPDDSTEARSATSKLLNKGECDLDLSSDAKRKRELTTSETSKELVVSKPILPKRSASNESKLLPKRLNRNQNKNNLRITTTAANQSSEPPPVQQMEQLQITEKGET